MKNNKTTPSEKIKISYGHALIETTGKITPQQVKEISDIVAQNNPDSDQISMGVSSSGGHLSIGKNVSGWRIAKIVFAAAGTFYVIKFFYNRANELFSIESVKVVEEAKKPPFTPTVIALSDVHLDADSQAQQIVGKLLYSGDRAIIYSSYGVGKSTFCINMGMDIARGQHSAFLSPEAEDTFHKPYVVFFYDAESDNQDLYRTIGTEDTSELKNFVHITNFFFRDAKEWLADVEKRTEGLSDVIVFLDNITSVTSTVNAETIRRLFLHDLKLIQRRAGKAGKTITFVVVAHTNKSLELAGSSNLSNFATTQIQLKRTDDKHVRLIVEKCRKNGDMQGKVYLEERKESDSGRKFFQFVKEVSVSEIQEKNDTKSKVREIYLTIQESDNKYSIEELCLKHGFSRQTFYDYKKEIEEELRLEAASSVEIH